MERWAKSVNAARAVQQQQLQAVIKAEAQVAASAPALVNPSSLTIADLSTKSGIALTAALKEVNSEIKILYIHCIVGLICYAVFLVAIMSKLQNKPVHYIGQ